MRTKLNQKRTTQTKLKIGLRPELSPRDIKVNFIIAGDFNRTDISEILHSYGALKQICSVPTRKNATLEIILTDLGHLFHPPTSLPPLEVDMGKKGEDADHNIVILAPKSNDQYYVKRKKKTITIRPLPASSILEFGKLIVNHTWPEVFNVDCVEDKVNNFHTTLKQWLDSIFPEKTIKISSLDKKWFTPQLKQLHRKLQREYLRHRKSLKWKKINRKFHILK